MRRLDHPCYALAGADQALTVRAKASMQETSEETLARYGASKSVATTSAAASKSTAQLWLDAGMRDVAHLTGMVWVALTLQTLLPVKGV